MLNPWFKLIELIKKKFHSNLKPQDFGEFINPTMTGQIWGIREIPKILFGSENNSVLSWGSGKDINWESLLTVRSFKGKIAQFEKNWES